METTYTFRKNNNNNKLLAFCTVTVLGSFKVNGIKIWDNSDGISVQLPGESNVAKNGKKYYNKYFEYVNHGHTLHLTESIAQEYLKWAEIVPVKQQDLNIPEVLTNEDSNQVVHHLSS